MVANSMASIPTKTYLIEGAKISLSVLSDLAGNLPAPVPNVISIAQRIIATTESVQTNQEDAKLLRERLLRLLPALLLAVKKACAEAENSNSLPPGDLVTAMARLESDLEHILNELDGIASVVRSKRKRNRLKAFFLSSSYASAIQQCKDNLDWAMKEFDVINSITDAVRLCDISRKVDVVVTNTTLESIPRAKYASHDSNRPGGITSCIPGTRVIILQSIMKWITDPDPAALRFYWLNGLAGIGKSTVARSIAERARTFGILGGDFFFSRQGEAELRDPKLVIPTLAYQLARFDVEFSRRITSALERYPEAPYAASKLQLHQLIISPLSGLNREPSRVVVLVFDAFDECEAGGAKELLQLMVSAIPQLPFFLKIFVTSRDEAHIRSVLAPSSSLVITALQDMEKAIVRSDIRLYLETRLRQLPVETGSSLPENWVAERDIDILANHAGDLFVHAATSIRFLSSAMDLKEELKFLINTFHTKAPIVKGSNPFLHLDDLYREILLNLLAPTHRARVVKRLQLVLGTIISLRDALPIAAIEQLAGLAETEGLNTLRQLRSIVLTSEDVPQVHHPSFSDFIRNHDRCADEDLWIDPQKHEIRMALRCLELMNGRLRTVTVTSGVVHMNFEPPSLISELAPTEELIYACKFWAAHLASIVVTEELSTVMNALDKFSSTQLLPWLETMSLLNEIRHAGSCLELACKWLDNLGGLASIAGLLRDCHRLLQAHSSSIRLSAAHISRSVLPFAPSQSRIAKVYSSYVDSRVKVTQGIASHWSAEIMTLKASSHVSKVVVSPDGSRIISSSERSLVMWDVASGGEMWSWSPPSYLELGFPVFSPDGINFAIALNQRDSPINTVEIRNATSYGKVLTLNGRHDRRIVSLRWSPDSSYILSASEDRTARLWNASSGVGLYSLLGHIAGVTCAVFQPDGANAATCSEDGTIMMWDLDADSTIGVGFQGHQKAITSLIFYPDGSRFVSASQDGTLKIWDVASGAQIASLQQGERGLNCVAVSADGRYLASGSEDNNVAIWDAKDYTKLKVFTGHNAPVRSVDFSPDASSLVSGSDDGTIKMWDVSSDGFHGKGKESQLELQLPDVRVGLMTDAQNVFIEDSRRVTCIEFSVDGTLIAVGYTEGVIRIWHVESEAYVSEFKEHGYGAITAIAIFPDGQRAVSGRRLDEALRLWDTMSGRELVVLARQWGTSVALAISPSGSLIASLDDAGAIRLWDADSHSQITDFKNCSLFPDLQNTFLCAPGLPTISLTPDGQRRIIFSSDGTLIHAKLCEDHSWKTWKISGEQLPTLTYFVDAASTGNVHLSDPSEEPRAVLERCRNGMKSYRFLIPSMFGDVLYAAFHEALGPSKCLRIIIGFQWGHMITLELYD